MLAALLALALLGACADLLGFEPLVERSDDGGESVPDARGEEEDAEAGPSEPRCVPAVLPGRPPAGSGGDAGSLRLGFGLSALAMAGAPGVSLDDLCTAPGQQPSCSTLSPEGEEYWTDGEDGSDRSSQQVATYISSFFDVMKDDKFMRAVNNGRFNWLIDLRGYNGQANDDAVGVVVHVSRGLARHGEPRQVAPDLTPDTPGAEWVPANGNGEQPTFAAGNGYVRDGQLVVRFDDPVPIGFADEARLSLPVDQLRLLMFTLFGATLTARVEATDGGEPHRYQLVDGLLYGRARMDDLLAEIVEFRSPRGVVCKIGLAESFANIRERLCQARDLNVAGDPSQACDGFSATLSFAAKAVTIGASETVAYPARICEAWPLCDGSNVWNDAGAADAGETPDGETPDGETPDGEAADGEVTGN